MCTRPETEVLLPCAASFACWQAIYENMGVRGSIPINKPPPHLLGAMLLFALPMLPTKNIEVCWAQSDPSPGHHGGICPWQQEAAWHQR